MIFRQHFIRKKMDEKVWGTTKAPFPLRFTTLQNLSLRMRCRVSVFDWWNRARKRDKIFHSTSSPLDVRSMITSVKFFGLLHQPYAMVNIVAFSGAVLRVKKLNSTAHARKKAMQRGQTQGKRYLRYPLHRLVHFWHVKRCLEIVHLN